MKLDRRFLNVSFVIQSVANAPPDNPVAGTQYIVGATPTGDFASATTNSIAYYDGTAWSFTAPEAGELEVFNVSTRELLSWDGTDWSVVITINDSSNIAPVLAIVPSGTSLPATASEDDVFLKIDEAKLYTATGADTWDSGTVVANGGRYASSTDHKIYTSDGSELTPEDVVDGGVFLNKEDSRLYVYNGSDFVGIGGSAPTYAIDVHSITAAEISAKSFSLTRSIASGQESNTSLSVAGLELAVGVDFVASGSTISWNGKGLEHAGLAAGDVIIVHYVTSAGDSGWQKDFAFAYLADNVRALQDDIVNLSSGDDDDQYADAISALEADVQALQDKVDSLSSGGDTSALEADVQALQDKVDSLSNGGDTSALEADVQALQDKVDSLSNGGDNEDINALTEAVYQLRQDVDNLPPSASIINITYQFISETETGV